MERHQHAVVQILSHLGQDLVYASHKPELLTTSMMVSAGNVPPLGTKRYPLPLIAFNFFSRVNIEQQECCVNFCDFSGFVWTFLCINWVFNAFMCIIHIWTTSTCSGAYKLVERQIFCPWVHAQVPCKKWEWMSSIVPPSLGRKHWDTWFINSSKSKTRLKFMKLGMLSWSGINMPWYNFCPNWGMFGFKLLTNQSFSQQAWWFR